jgi:hypothetical protein
MPKIQGRKTTSHTDIERIKYIQKALTDLHRLARKVRIPKAAKQIGQAIRSVDSARRYAERQWHATLQKRLNADPMYRRWKQAEKRARKELKHLYPAEDYEVRPTELAKRLMYPDMGGDLSKYQEKKGDRE